MPAKLRLLRLRLQRPVSLRFNLIFLVLVTTIPLLVFSVALIFHIAREERVTFQRGATERTRALLTAVDTELKRSITTLEALATSRRLDTDDLPGFYDAATRVLSSQPDWFTINLANLTGQQVLNLRRPLGSELPMTRERQSFEQVLRTGQPAIGHMIVGPVTNEYEFSVRVPVVRDGVTKYVLSAVVKPQAISALLSAQKLPPDWIGVVLDGNRRFVSRTVNPEQSMGQLASQSLRGAVHRAPEGWFQGTTVEGWEVYTPYNRSAFSGWTVAMGIPVAAVEATLRSSLFFIISFGIALLALGLGLAWYVSSRTAGSIQAVAGMAKLLGLGKGPFASVPPPDHAPSPISEVQDLRDSFLTAARLIEERSEERDRVETALREVSERLELSQEAANIGSFERDLVTNQIKWSASQEKLYGLPPGTFGGRPDDWARRVHPDDIAAVEAAIRRAAKTISPINLEFRIIRPDGAVRWVASQARVFADQKGAARRLFGVNIDVTERKLAEQALRASEALLRTATDHARVGLVVLDAERRYTFANPAYADVLGLPSADIIGKRVPEVLGPLYEQARPQLDRAFAGERVSYELIAPPIPGRSVTASRYYAVIYEPQRDTDGVRVIGVVAVVVDITDRKQAEEALRAAGRAKDQFLAMLGHELRNPLGVISTAVQLLRKKGPPDPGLTELREMIERQVEHMTQLMDDLLDVSRVARGRIQLNKKSCDFSAIVRDMAEDYRGALETSGLQMTLDVPDRPLWVMGDRTRLAQAVGNLLHNANKFTDCGGKIGVRLIKAPDGEAAVLSVSDTGVGMEPEILAHAFEPFTQADRTIDRSRGGLGLGLALVKGLVELHGGEVQASSNGSGRGSQITIRLPLEKSPAPQPKPVETVPLSIPSHRILIIEDNVVAARSLSMFLTAIGHIVEVAHNGPEGIEAARRSPEVVLCDIGLPGLDGYEVARALRGEARLQGVYLIAVTGYGQDDDQRRALEAGFNMHMTKPINLDDLERVLANLERTPDRASANRQDAEQIQHS